MRPRERQRLAWSQAGVREDRDERGVADEPPAQQPGADGLDRLAGERHNGARSTHGWLPHRRDRVGRNPAPLTRAPQHALQQRECLANRRRPNAVGLELQAEAVDDVGRQLAQRHRAEARGGQARPTARRTPEASTSRGSARRSASTTPRRSPTATPCRRRAAPARPCACAVRVRPRRPLRRACAPSTFERFVLALPPAHPPHDAPVLALDPFDAHDFALLVVAGQEPEGASAHRRDGAHLDDMRLDADGRSRDPLVEPVARDPQPRAQAHCAQLAALDRAVDRSRGQTGERCGFCRP